MTSHLILSLTFSAKSATGRRRVRGGVEMVGEQCGLGWRWSANSAGWGGDREDGGGEQCEVGLGRRVARGSVRLVGEECGVGWRWSANSAGWGGDREDGGGEQCEVGLGRRVARGSVRLVGEDSHRYE